MTFKKESQKNWGELVNFDAMDAIFRACAELENQEKSINREAVKTLSGVGFTTQLAAGIALYKDRKSLTDQLKSTPEILTHAVCQAFETALQKYDSQLEEKLGTERDLFITSLSQATQEYEALLLQSQSQAQLITELESKLSAATHERDNFQELVDQQKKSLTEQVQQQQQISWKLQQSQQQALDLKHERQSLLAQHTEQMNSLKKENTENLQRSAVVAEKEQNRLMRLIAQDRDDHKRSIKVATTKISELENRLAIYQQSELEKERVLAKSIEKIEVSKNREVILQQEIEELKSKILKLEKRASRTEADLIQGALDGVVSQLKAEFRKPAESVKS